MTKYYISLNTDSSPVQNPYFTQNKATLYPSCSSLLNNSHPYIWVHMVVPITAYITAPIPISRPFMNSCEGGITLYFACPAAKISGYSSLLRPT